MAAAPGSEALQVISSFGTPKFSLLTEIGT